MEKLTETNENIQTDHENTSRSLFGGKIKLNNRQILIIKIAVPLLFVIICAFSVKMMLSSSLRASNNVDGRFESAVNSDYIDMDSDGEYVLVKAGKTEKGQWELSGNSFNFKSGGKSMSGQLIERKYIVIIDEEFLSGDVTSDEESGFEVTSVDGIVYGFKPDGKVYSIEEGTSTEIGKYISDGYFINVTTADEYVTYIKCSTGITSVFYQAV